MGVLYIVQYAHSALGSLCAQSFPPSRIIFFRMLLTSLLLTSTCMFAWELTRRDREVVDFTRSRVKNYTELTNLGN